MAMEGQVVIITGASTGIGAHTAEHLSTYKPKLALVARSDVKLQEVKARCVAKGVAEDDVLLIVASVSKEEDLSRIIKETVEKFGQIDHLVNNAACMAFEDIQHSTIETYQQVMDTNLRAPWFLTKEAMPYLKKTKGSIVNISSVNSELAEYRCAAYCISKTALEHLTRITALEVAKDGVRVNTVTPGFVVTDTMLHNFPEDKRAEMEEKFVGYGLKAQHLGGAVRMPAVAKTIYFLLSDGACSITGESVRVDNGYHVTLPDGMSMDQFNNTGVHHKEPTQERQAKKKMEAF